MRILVAGGAGYIGSVAVPRLLERGHDVDVVDALWFGNHLPEGVNLLQRNLLTLTEEELSGYRQVIYLAGVSNDPMAEHDPVRTYVENAAGAGYLAYAAKRAGVERFIYGGSCSVYGYTAGEPYDEAAPTNSHYPYAISKLQGELACLQLRDDRFSVVCFRQGTVSGYSPRMRLDLIVNTMFMTAVRDREITVNNPAIWRPILAIQDAASALVCAVEAPPEISGVFNLASGNYTVGDVADRVRLGVKATLGIDARIVIRDIPDARNYRVSTERAARMLSFEPRYEVGGIVEELAEHLECFQPFEQDRFFNLRSFKRIPPGPK